MVDALVIAGCLSGEESDAGVAALVRELTEAIGADAVVRARTGGRPVGRPLSEVLGDLRHGGARRVLVATTHVARGRLQREAEATVRAAAPGFDELRLAPPLLANEEDCAVVAAALDEALPARTSSQTRRSAFPLAWLRARSARSCSPRSLCRLATTHATTCWASSPSASPRRPGRTPLPSSPPSAPSLSPTAKTGRV